MNQSTKFLISVIKENRKEITKIMLIATLGSVMTVITPYVYGKLFDLSIIPETSVNMLVSLIMIWMVLGLVSTLLSHSTSFFGSILGMKIALKTEAEIYGHFIKLPVSFHKKHRSGEILHRISRGTWSMQTLIEQISYILPQALMLVFSLIAMILVRWELALIISLSFFLYIVITLKMTKSIMKIQEKEHRQFERRYGEVYDKLYNIPMIKNYVKEEKEKVLFFNALVERLIPMVRYSHRKSTKLSIIQDTIYNVSFVMVLGVAIFFLRAGSITPGQFVMFFGYVNLAFGPFRSLSWIYNCFKRSSVGVKRFLRLKKVMPEEMKHGNKVIEDFSGGVRFEGVSFGYTKDKKVLKNISLKINPGESAALVGRSGVGKTTLSELILGYYKPEKGRILFDGVDISKLKLSWIREQIALVPQEISLFNDTLINNIRYANQKAKEEEILIAAGHACADEFICGLPKKYKTRVGERGFKLSTGQKQRVALAMAFLKNPKILILDEPTSSLDAKSEKLVQEGMKNLIKGRTTIIIAHRFSTVRGVDKIIVLDEGKVAEVGSHEELMKKKGLYHELYSLQRGLD